MENTQNEILLKIISLIKSSEEKYKEKNFKGFDSEYFPLFFFP